jgi:hypothetical protein
MVDEQGGNPPEAVPLLGAFNLDYAEVSDAASQQLVLLDYRTCGFTGRAKAPVFVGISVVLVFPKPEYLQSHSG